MQSEPLFRLSRFRQRFSEASGQVFSLYSDGLTRVVREASLSKKLFAGAAVVGLLLGTGYAVEAFGATTTAIQGLGFGGYLLHLTAKRLEHNRHTTAMMSLSTGIIAAHKALLGAWGFAIMCGIAASRTATLSMMPDNEEVQRKRARVGLAYAAAGTPLLLTSMFMDTWWTALNLLAMIGGTSADILISNEKKIRAENKIAPEDEVTEKLKDKSPYARLCRLFAVKMNFIYSLGYSGSLSAIVSEVANAAIQVQSIRHFDVPKESKDGRKISLREGWGLYTGRILAGRHHDSLTPADVRKRDNEFHHMPG